jgi:hypothetical protein
MLVLGASTSGFFDFTATPPASVTVDTINPPVSGPGYAFGATSFTAGPLSGNAFSAGPNSETVDFSSSGNHLDGTITWTAVTNAHSVRPDLVGTLTYTASGDAAFTADFGSSGTADITLVLTSGPTFLDQLPFFGFSQQAFVSSGQITASPPPIISPGQHQIDEPGLLLLLGLGLLFISWMGASRGRDSQLAGG